MARITGRKTWPCIGSLAMMAAVAGASVARLDAQTPMQTQVVVTQAAPPARVAVGGAFEWVAAAPAVAADADVVFMGDVEQAPVPMTDPVMAIPGKPFFGGDAKVVTGAPYSADAVTEMIQTLADGNRIVQRQSASVARDGQGRTRRDMALGAIGPLMPEDPPRIVFIHDPVAGVVYQIMDQKRTATRRTIPKPGENDFVGVHVDEGQGIAFGAAGVASYKARTSVKGVGPRHDVGEVAVHIERGPAAKGADMQTENLGTQNVEGVDATGTRTTTTIPAGQIGNEQPIKIVSESWYSAELQTMVLTKRSDPRFGETSYRLTNIVRAEPAPGLFEVPAGYTVTDEPDILRMKITRDQMQQQQR